MTQRIFTWIFAAALLCGGGSWIYAQVPTGTNTQQGGAGSSSSACASNCALETGGNLAAINANTAAAVPAGTNYIGQVGISAAGGFTDPCQAQTHVYKPITIPTGTTTNLITGTSAKKLYICQIVLATGAANNVAVVEGTTGGTCGSSTAGIFGGTTAANGFNFGVNGGVSIGMGGYAIGQTATSANDLCIITSASGPLAGGITYVVQ